jgi:hypothetical protein
MLPWSQRQTTAWDHYQRHCSKPQLKIECVRVWNRSRIIVSPRVFKGGTKDVCKPRGMTPACTGGRLYAGQMTKEEKDGKKYFCEVSMLDEVERQLEQTV